MMATILGFREYRRSQIAELRPYEVGEDLNAVSISGPDRAAGSPKDGDMIARNPKNHADQWLVAAKYFADNFEPMPRAYGLPAGTMQFEVYQHWLSRQWRWRLKSANNRVIADSGESYYNKQDCLDAAALLKNAAAAAVLIRPAV